jgi:hypothetical protein
VINTKMLILYQHVPVNGVLIYSSYDQYSIFTGMVKIFQAWSRYSRVVNKVDFNFGNILVNPDSLMLRVYQIRGFLLIHLKLKKHFKN